MSGSRSDTLIVCADAVQLLAGLADACVAAVVTDPPWNRGKRYGNASDSVEEVVYVAWLRGVLRECGRVSRGPVAMFLGAEHTARLPDLLAGTGLEDRVLMGWQRSSGVIEPVAVCSRPDAGPLPQGALHRVEFVLATAHEPEETHGHPCPKPLAAVEALVELVAPDGGVVLDPFVGVGTTILAAQRAGVAAIGMELEWRFCRTAALRAAGKVPEGRHGG
jgi:site-specific DNA-methyltransferase (adenine-specific)